MKPADLPTANMQRFFDVWSTFRAPGALVPQRSALDPMKFGNLLESVALSQRHGPGDFRYSVLGTAVNVRMGMNPVGVSISHLLHDRVTAFAGATFETAINSPCGLYTQASVEFEERRDLSIRTVCFPFTGGDGKDDFLLFFHHAWDPSLGNENGKLLSVGEQSYSTDPVDIGGGVPADFPLLD